MSLAADGGLVLTGRLSTRTHPWLADHAVAGTVLFPGTGFVELAIRAGDEVGCSHLKALTLQAPLVLPEHTAVRIQVVVGAPDGTGDRALTVHSRPENAAGDAPWTSHAEGVLTAAQPAVPAVDLTAWPPPGAETLDVSGFYADADAAAAGYGYGPAFQGLKAAWRRGDEVFAEVALDGPHQEEAGRYGIHPALLDAALHAVLAADAGDGGLRLPFLWEGLSLLAVGASAVRVRLAPAGGDAVSVAVADTAGAPVAWTDSLVLRPVTAEQLAAAAPDARDAVFRVEWTPAATPGAPAPRAQAPAVIGDDPFGLAREARHADLAALVAAEGDIPRLIVHTVATAGDGAPAAAAADATGRLLTTLQRWLAEERVGDARLVVVTRGAVAAGA
ncbi:polyketide synthase dehydratase domain-containing protein, partial [Streptomyces capparidis]